LRGAEKLTLGLRDEEPDEEEHGKAEASDDEICACTELVDRIQCRLLVLRVLLTRSRLQDEQSEFHWRKSSDRVPIAKEAVETLHT
jgi:hypothetical protein